MKKIVGIIPARFSSSRLPGKPLADIGGKPMIQHVYEAASQALDAVYVATDDQRIAAVVTSFGGRCVMTSPDHINGSSRCLEAWEIITNETKNQFDVIINIQGDEPLLHPATLRELTQCFTDPTVAFATLATPALHEDELQNNSEVFVVLDAAQNAMYFSRAVIPYLRDVPREQWLAKHTFYKHLGIYGYTPKALREFSNLKPGKLELLESLEQLRWIENGNALRVGITQHSSIPVDTPADLDKVRTLYNKQQEK
ncbi:MAG: 3-deoxy-manno-octulosonate cytidylyltransferase [Schleiferiaceae bacterium]|jgi:3-deoxy-manno-octulosonate cytidylyltransferase (CMP-KDO synthetase)|nr:3-deoxy-manno-octulosonate cytidylyltransferase [Schleiferiaceae bacterium]